MFDFFKKKKPIDDQIRVFLKYRKRRELSSYSYERVLYDFANFSGLDDIYDATPLVIVTYNNHLRENKRGEWSVIESERIVRQFLRYYSARGKMVGNLADYSQLCYKEGVKILADVKRNRQLVQLRCKNPEKWSWRKLGQHFDIHFTTAKQIFERDVEKYRPMVTH